MSAAQLRLVRDDRDALPIKRRAERLRALIHERDDAVRALALLDRNIAQESRRWADFHGLTLRPTVAQLKRELF
jgi:hypothetical protein